MQDSSLRVLHIIGQATSGGTESVAYNYYRAIDRSKVQFDFVIDEDSLSDIPADILVLGCKCYKTPSYKHLNSYIKSLKKIMADGHYQMVHSHLNALSIFPLFAAKRAVVPVRIAHSHSTSGKGEFTRNVMKSVLKRFSRLFPTHLFACSEHAGRWLFGNRAFDNSKVTVIRNAIDTAKYQFNREIRERVRLELGIEDKLVIGHVGRFMPQKNHTFLLDIFAEIKKLNTNCTLLLIGIGELKSSMEEKARHLGLTDSIMFLGARDDVSALYQAMDIFVLPSLYEGFGLVALEAQCSGLACVLSTEVPQETKACEYVDFIPLNTGADKWAKAVLEQSQKDKDRYETGRSCAELWDINSEAWKLAEMYLTFAGEA
ncbi:MAG: glycosyltransferase family 1 protein [Clostridiales Family XIII bacterium]|jgi:glycosyltransferase EpsF|nr:glycosyltransferase family 1 protein [Clostridiales Family XIII bacterium]